MNFEISDILNMSIASSDGDSFLQLDNVTELETKITSEQNKQSKPAFKQLGGCCTFEVDNAFLNNDELKKLVMSDCNNHSYSFESDFKYAIQNRKHKRNRINKKWLKRYGVTVWTVKASGEVNSLGEDGQIDLSYDKESTNKILQHYDDITFYNYCINKGIIK